MKKIEAIIRPARFEELKVALDALEIRGMTVYEVKGRRLQREQKQYYRGQERKIDLFPKIKVEIICRDHWVDRIIEAIVKVCQTGKVGDGKIIVYPVERIVRISTGEEGEAAL